MSLQTEKLILKGRLQEFKMEKMKLAGSVEANVRAAKSLLAASSVTPLAELDLVGANQQLTEAAAQQAEYLKVCGQIRTIEEELA